MAGRGRGRGRGMSINVESLGLGRGDLITPIVAQPPPLYPPLQFMPVPLSENSDLEYMFALKQEMRESCKKSPFYITAPKKSKDIERYSDKYQPGCGDMKQLIWTPDWTRLPSELKDGKKRKVKRAGSKSVGKTTKLMKDDVASLLDNLEKTAATSNADDEDDAEEEGDDATKKKEEELIEDEEEEYEDEDLEEETDYNLAYFDNGEGYGDEDDDDDEGPTY